MFAENQPSKYPRWKKHSPPMPTRDNLKFEENKFPLVKFRKICFLRNLFRKITDREKKKICIDQNGIEEENFEKRRICIGKTE